MCAIAFKSDVDLVWVKCGTTAIVCGSLVRKGPLERANRGREQKFSVVVDPGTSLVCASDAIEFAVMRMEPPMRERTCASTCIIVCLNGPVVHAPRPANKRQQGARTRINHGVCAAEDVYILRQITLARSRQACHNPNCSKTCSCSTHSLEKRRPPRAAKGVDV
mmetsp:Transcript_8877/g.16991  ORF Transcript_8877/g.16991 Transcript_8877/m.16991 type:complete len:164 (-) Transcript_8877:37-528(-)